MIITARVREPTAGPQEGCKGTAESPSETQVIPWAHLAEDKEGADIPETGLLLEEVFHVDALKGLEAADQGDEGLVLCIVCDALEDGHHGSQAGAGSQHEELPVLGNKTVHDGWVGRGSYSTYQLWGLFLGLLELDGTVLLGCPPQPSEVPSLSPPGNPPCL